MKRALLNALVVTGTTLLIVTIFVGGWMLLDNFLNPTYVPYGTRALYQEASRTVTMAQPVLYVGAEQCEQCHLSIEQEWLHSSHRVVTCENCHGPRSAHIENGVSIPINTSADLCLTCHAQLAGRPDTFPQVLPEEHSNGLSCLQCHNPMHPDMSNPPPMTHALHQGVDCLTCHGAQGFRPVPNDHEGRAGESCPQCHIIEEGQ